MNMQHIVAIVPPEMVEPLESKLRSLHVGGITLTVLPSAHRRGICPHTVRSALILLVKMNPILHVLRAWLPALMVGLAAAVTTTHAGEALTLTHVHGLSFSAMAHASPSRATTGWRCSKTVAGPRRPDRRTTTWAMPPRETCCTAAATRHRVPAWPIPSA